MGLSILLLWFKNSLNYFNTPLYKNWISHTKLFLENDMYLRILIFIKSLNYIMFELIK
jgi:hypothetical protein